MKKAWVEGGIIRDVAQGDPFQLYHADVAVHYDIPVPDDAANGDAWVDGVLTKRSIAQAEVAIAAPVPPTITKTHFLLSFTSAERVKARSLRATDPILDDFWLVLDTVEMVDLALPATQSGIEYTLIAVKAAGLTDLDVAARKVEILTGPLR